MGRLVNPEGLIQAGNCQHCEGKIIYECDRFKVEMTKRGMVYELYGGCSLIEAADTYRKWLELRDNPIKEGM